MDITLILKILKILSIIVIVLMAIPLYIFFGFGSLFAFDSPGSFNWVNIIKVLMINFIAFITPIGMIAGIILGDKINSHYYFLILAFPLLLYIAIKCFFKDV